MIRMTWLTALCLFYAFPSTGVEADDQQGAVISTTSAGVTCVENLAYRNVGGKPLMLDLAHPEGGSPHPCITFIHGGGWYLGDRHGYRELIREAARRGYVGVTIDYRLMDFDESEKDTTTATTNFPAQVHDVRAAIRWLRQNASRYQIDPERIGATGRSAGGHLSLLLGLADRSDGFDEDTHQISSRVQAVVNVFGPTELIGCYEGSSVRWIFRLFAGGTPDEVPENYRLASPVNYVTNDDPPVLTLHGDEDRAVPFNQAVKLDEAMKSVAASHTLTTFSGQGHGFGGEHRRRELDLMWRFFDEHLKTR